MAIEIIPRKEKEEAILSQGKFFQVGLALILLFIISSLAFHFLKWRFSQEISAIDVLIKEQRVGEIVLLEKKINGYYRRTKNLSPIIETKKSSLPILETIEKLVHPLVFFSEFEVNVSKNTIKALGVAKNIVAFDQQLRIFREEKSIVSVSAPEFSIKEDRTISFPINIVLK